ncbi:GNAT family N-acetyltransferase [Halobacillus mangrovi]|uniref:GNAT family N-acetyltransferase n=1 Tax=Halobacillus mangrovi TaxID=402384 RepID=UPI003D9717EC
MISIVQPEEASAFVSLSNQLEKESDFLLYEAGERGMSIEKARSFIKSLGKQENSVLFAARDHNKLIGYVMCIGGTAKRNRHFARVVTGVLAGYQGMGWGSQLFEKVDGWAIDHHIHRLELTAMVHNARALKLYKKVGFQVEGIKKHSLLVNGKWVDEYLMAKLF